MIGNYLDGKVNSPEELEQKLMKLQDEYDRTDHNPVRQAQIASKIHMLTLWIDLYKEIS